MTKAVWKWTVGVGQSIIPNVPKGAKFLSAEKQDDKIAVWALLDPLSKEREDHTFHVTMTGQHFDVEGELEHLGTCLFHHESFVLHVFHKLG